MSGEIPFFITGEVVEIWSVSGIAIAKVCNGNIYHLRRNTPGIDFSKLELGTLVDCEVTSALARVLSAKIVGKINKEQ